MSRTARTKYATGFRLLSTLKDDGLIHYPVATTISITKGDCVFDNGSGYATDATTAFDATFLGVAAADADNTSGANGAINVAIIPPRPGYKFMVANASATVATQSDCGEIVDLEANNSVDVTDTTIANWGFLIEEIDISTAALASNTGGYVIGRFQLEGDQA